jgi:predicted KAP-like P-loop ATPase
MLYDLEARDAIVRRAMQQLHILIKCANEFDGNLDVVVKKNLEDYLKTEEAYIRANKNHESFPQLVSLLEEIFRTRVYIITELLRGKGETYDELVRTAFSREEVEKVTRKQFELAERVINLVKEEKGLIRIPFIIRLEVFRLLETEFDWYKRNIEEEINKMYER